MTIYSNRYGSSKHVLFKANSAEKKRRKKKILVSAPLVFVVTDSNISPFNQKKSKVP